MHYGLNCDTLALCVCACVCLWHKCRSLSGWLAVFPEQPGLGRAKAANSCLAGQIREQTITASQEQLPLILSYGEILLLPRPAVSFTSVCTYCMTLPQKKTGFTGVQQVFEIWWQGMRDVWMKRDFGCVRMSSCTVHSSWDTSILCCLF